MLVEMSVEVVSELDGGMYFSLGVGKVDGRLYSSRCTFASHAAVSKYRSGVPAETTPK